MPKLTKERRFLLKSALIYTTYPAGKARKTRNSLGEIRNSVITKPIVKRIQNWKNWMKYKNENILTGNQIPEKFKVIRTKNPNWMYIRVNKYQSLRTIKTGVVV